MGSCRSVRIWDSGMTRSKLSTGTGRPEDGLSLAKGPASGLFRPARLVLDSIQSVPRCVAAVQSTGLEMRKDPEGSSLAIRT
jgi:hypothetical protein